MALIISAVRNACLNRISLLDTRDKVRQRMMLATTAENFDVESRNFEVRQAIQKLLTPREQDVVERIYSDGFDSGNAD